MPTPTALLRSMAITTLLALAVAMQAQSLEQWTTWGDASMARGEHYGASRYYDGALSLEPGRMSLQWKLAEACRLSNQYDRAAALYEKVHRKDMGRTFPDALRWLGEMQLSMGGYDNAEDTWNKVIQREKDKRSPVASRAINALAGISLARAQQAVVPSIELFHLPAPVNSYDSEFAARRGPDSALYFTSLRGELNTQQEVVDTTSYKARIYRSHDSTGQWTGPHLLDIAFGSGDVANPTWTLSGKWMFFSYCPDGGSCRIHFTPFDGMSLLPTPLEGLGTEMSTQPMIVSWEGREMLLFVSDRPGGQGGTDIWQARLENGKAVDVHPLNGAVNTQGNERCPWYDTLSNTLWFSSDHLPGLGGYDIFTAVLDNDVFSTPINAGVPINSPSNDLYPTLRPDQGEGWLTSNRKGSFAAKGETCCNDLYRWTYSRTTDTLLQTPVDASKLDVGDRNSADLAAIQQQFPLKLYFHNDEPEPRSWALTTDQDYGSTYVRYKSLLPDYLHNQKDPQRMSDFFHSEVDAGMVALGELVQVLQIELELGNSITLDVRGHASPLARNGYNRNLSSRRIESLRRHLRVVNDAVLVPFLDGKAPNNATLTVRELPLGEERSATDVSDDLLDLQRSVYSVEAARERRIEVVAVELVERSTPSLGTVQLTKELGDITQDQERSIVFPIRNNGTRPMRLLETSADCGCTTAELPKEELLPGDEVPVNIHFSGRAPLGSLKRTVYITTDGEPQRYELVILGTVVH